MFWFVEISYWNPGVFIIFDLHMFNYFLSVKHFINTTTIIQRKFKAK